MNDQTTYKRTKVYWWLPLLLAGICVWMIFAYIHQWGNNPISSVVVLIMIGVIMFAFVVVCLPGRFVFIIDDEFIIFNQPSLWGSLKIHIAQIKEVSVHKVSFKRAMIFRGHQFDFTKQVVRILMKSGNVYHISIRNAERIKEEIEKRMLKQNNI